MSRALIVVTFEDPYETTVFMEYSSATGYRFITEVSGNDGNWRGEYFDPVLEHFGLAVKSYSQFDGGKAVKAASQHLQNA